MGFKRVDNPLWGSGQSPVKILYFAMQNVLIFPLLFMSEKRAHIIIKGKHIKKVVLSQMKSKKNALLSIPEIYSKYS